MQRNLRWRSIGNGLEEFWMDEIEVDGIVSYAYVRNRMFSLKSEVSDGGQPADTGTPFVYRADFEADEEAWLKRALIIRKT